MVVISNKISLLSSHLWETLSLFLFEKWMDSLQNFYIAIYSSDLNQNSTNLHEVFRCYDIISTEKR